MRVSITGNRFTSSPSPAIPSSAGKGNFQTTAPAPSLIRSYFQNAPTTAMPSLGSQTISALLQLQAQELEETEAHSRDAKETDEPDDHDAADPKRPRKNGQSANGKTQ